MAAHCPDCAVTHDGRGTTNLFLCAAHPGNQIAIHRPKKAKGPVPGTGRKSQRKVEGA